MHLELIFAPDTVSLSCLIALEEYGLPYQLKHVDLSRGHQNRSEFLAINPNGRVPVLKIDGIYVSETVAILDFIQEIADSKAGISSKLIERARRVEFCSYLASTVHVAYAHGRRGYRWAQLPSSHEDMQDRVLANLNNCARLVEDKYLSERWIHGNFSVSDCYLLVFERWFRKAGVDFRQYPNISEHYQNMLRRPSASRALDIECDFVANKLIQLM
jgi:glutathione S-transferase